MNTAPVTVNDFITIDEDTTIEFLPQLNDIDDDGDTLTVTEVYYSNNNSGYGYVGANGGIQYTAYNYANEDTTDYISYVVSDGNGGAAAGTVEITIRNINSLPEVTVFNGYTDENQIGSFYLSVYDYDEYIDSRMVTFSGPDGALLATPNEFGDFSFITAPDFENPGDADGDNVYEFTASVTDLSGGTSSTTASIIVYDIDEFGQTEGDDVLQGTQSNDYINLLGGNDKYFAKGGDDDVAGGAGSDTIFGDEGNDFLFGSEGDDKLIGGNGGDELFGGDGDDTLSGEAGDEYITGDAGDDRVYGGPGDDYIQGQEGDDVLFGDDGDDYLDDWSGNNRLYGGEGNDQLTVYSYYSDVPEVNTLRGGGGNDTLTAESGRARLFGDSGDDVLKAREENDLLVGGSGNDDLYGLGGNDRLNGENGNDTLDAGSGDDQMNGGAGIVWLFGGAGNDRMIGGDDADELYGQDGNDTLFGGDGGDSLNGGAGDDRLDAGAGGNYIETGTGADTIIVGHYDGATTENDDFDFTQDKLIIRAFDGNAQTLIDSEAELFALNLDGLTVYDDTTSTHLEFSLDDGTSHVFTFHGVTQFDLG